MMEDLAGWGQGTWTSTSGPAAENPRPHIWKLSWQLLVIRRKHLIPDQRLPPHPRPLSPSPRDGDKSALAARPPRMRSAARRFFYSALPLPFLLFRPLPSPTHTTHCIHIFKCKIKLQPGVSPQTLLPALIYSPPFLSARTWLL